MGKPWDMVVYWDYLWIRYGDIWCVCIYIYIHVFMGFHGGLMGFNG